MAKKEAYCIIKKMLPAPNSKTQHVIIVDSTSEIMEFNDKDEADRIAKLFETNSDSGYEYIVKKI